MPKESTGQRGKKSEKIVEELFKRWNSSASFAFHRMADSRSARNYLAANPGDFLFFVNGRGGIAEIKSIQHPYRIAKDKISQLPVLHKLEMAGAVCIVVVHHTVENVWRCIDVRDLPLGVPSWDLREFETYGSAEEALKSIGWFEGV